MFFLLLAIMAPSLGIAQFDEDPGGDPEVPIDGGLSILLAAGAGYVVKKGYERKKKREGEAGGE